MKDSQFKKDPAREMCVILDNGKVCCDEMADFNKFALDLVQPILDIMPNVDTRVGCIMVFFVLFVSILVKLTILTRSGLSCLVL